jgi:GH24 family phage-related lysozyme (muramidase)
MPFISGRFYANPAYGRAVEAARAAEAASQHHERDQQEPDAHWVTIDGHHVLIRETQAGRVQHEAQGRHLSSKGLDFIKRHEGYSDKVYEDSAGNPTIGYGHKILPGEDFSKGITEKEASVLLAQDTKTAVRAVNDEVTAELSQTQFDALVDFTYNLGAGNLEKSTLLANINSGKDITKENFTDWNQAAGRVVRGLTIRRSDEYNLFSKGEYSGP